MTRRLTRAHASIPRLSGQGFVASRLLWIIVLWTAAGVLGTSEPSVGQLRREVTPGRLTVITEADAAVELDEQPAVKVGPSGEITFESIEPGAHKIKVSRRGAHDWERKIALGPGQSLRIEARLKELTGILEILTTPGAEVSIDGESRGTAGRDGVLRLGDVKLGGRRVTASKIGFQQREIGADVRADLPVTVSLDLSPVAVPPAGPARVATPLFELRRTIGDRAEALALSPDGSWFASCPSTSSRLAVPAAPAGGRRAGPASEYGRYVKVTGTKERVTASGWRSCRLSPVGRPRSRCHSLAQIYTISAKSLDEAASKADGMLPPGNRYGDETACGNALRALKEDVSEARSLLEQSRTDAAVQALVRAREQQKTLNQLIAGVQPNNPTRITLNADITAVTPSGPSPSPAPPAPTQVTLTVANIRLNEVAQADVKVQFGSREIDIDGPATLISGNTYEVKFTAPAAPPDATVKEYSPVLVVRKNNRVVSQQGKKFTYP